jgi:hypothetical protein
MMTRKFAEEPHLWSSADIVAKDACAVFISSESKQTPIWCQQLSVSPDEHVLWDYHVVFIVFFSRCVDETHEVYSMVYDLDSTLDFPCNAKEYIEKAFRPSVNIKREHQQKFRIVPATSLLEYFASDRSHMKNSGMPFPNWPIICGPKAESSMNLYDYMSVEDSPDRRYVRLAYMNVKNTA